MTERPLGPTGAGRPANGNNAPESFLTRALTRAWWVLTWERLWPRISLPVTVAALFLVASWAGLWQMLPAYGRMIGLGLFALAFLASFYPLFRIAFPTRANTLSRVDTMSGVAHRPATTMMDRLAAGATDQGSQTLWEAHVARASAAAREFKVGTPRPGLAKRDPYALRALVAILLVTTFVAAGSDRWRMLRSAFDFREAMASANYRIDAWVTPPNYTGRPPVLLPGVRAGEPMRETQTIAVPTGSVLVIRASGVTLDIVANGLTEAAPEQAAARPTGGATEHRYTVTQSGTVTVRGAGRDIVWTFTAIPDRAPTIALAKDPEPQARGSVRLTYRIEDDYGVNRAEAKITPKKVMNRNARPLYGPPTLPLVLPQARTRNGVGQTIKDLSEHPWAGTEVVMVLVAYDEGGNEGRSDAHEFILPQRPFYKPVAKALVEQRRILATDAEMRNRVQRAIDALTIAPERFTPEASIYLGLRTIYHMLANAKSDDDLRAAADRMWAMALAIEDGNVSDAEQALRQAQDALRQALERGASEEEIKRLMDQLRAALDKYMQALAEEMRKNPQLARPLDRNAREVRPQDLRSMLDKLEDLARSGNKDAARAMLEQLQQLLENLQTARPGQQGDDNDDMAALDELQDMIRSEQQLRDKTFQQGQEQRRERQQRGQRGQRGQQGQQGQQGQEPGEQGQGQMGDLKQNQQALRDRLNKLLEELRKRGQGGQQPGQGQDGSDPLGQAEQAMRDAEESLGQGDAEGAGEAQGRAIESMRRGAGNMAQQMQQGGPNGPGPNGQPSGRGQQRAQQDTDPLGRPLRGRDYGDDVTVKVPGEIDVQRARRILEELRRRFSDPARPQMELEYIERLLKDF